MADCFYKCGYEALDGHLTCGKASCNEADARAAQHSRRRGARFAGPAAAGLVRSRARSEGAPGSSAGATPSSRTTLGTPVADDALVDTRAEGEMCGEMNRYVHAVCKLRRGHASDHVSGKYRWLRGGRPYELAGDELALATEHLPPPSDAERLAELTQVLLTARAQMLGLGTGLKKALDEMPRSVDSRAVAGLIASLTHIVAGLSKHVVTEQESGIRKEAVLGTDQITASHFDRGAVRSSWAPPGDSRSSVVSAAPVAPVAIDVCEEGEELLSGDDWGLPPFERSQVIGPGGVDSGSATMPKEHELVQQGLVHLLQRKLSELEVRLQELIAERATAAPAGAFQAILDADARAAGRDLSEHEKQALMARAAGEMGLSKLVATSEWSESEWFGIVRELERLGLLQGSLAFHRPTLAGYRLAIVLLSIGNGKND